jgi:SAM-dependent methyltransferase
VTHQIDDQSTEHRKIWQTKPGLRLVYEDIYSRIRAECAPGSTLEIGGGSGNFKEYFPSVVSIDIQPLPWVDIAADAQAIPISDSAFDNIVMVDTLHHLERPIKFFKEASRILRRKGRLIMVEPMISPLSNIFYTHFHPEPVDMRQEPLIDGPLNPNRRPFDSNQAIPTILFLRQRKLFEQHFSEFIILKCREFSLIAYPLSGGFRAWTALPAFVTPSLLWIERRVEGILAPFVGFRMIITLEKK